MAASSLSRVQGAVEESLKPKDTINLDSCRKCSPSFTYSLPSGGNVTILSGIPPDGLRYKAISHVWSPYSLVDTYCQGCGTTIQIPLRSISTFRNIMALAGPQSSIWLDNISINQDDPSDVAAQVAVMGNIYSKAECVSVLLPPSDEEAYQTLANLVSTAKVLLHRKGQFDYNPLDEVWSPGPGEDIEATGQLAKGFFKDIEAFQANLPKYTYWRRAWTFQEWANSHDVEVTVDDPEESKIRYPAIRKVKSTIVFSTIMIGDYKLRKADYALMDLGFSRGLVKPRLDDVKRLFPFEEAFASLEEIPDSELRFQTAFPNFGTHAILGLRPTPRPTRTADATFRNRLSLMLGSFSGGPEREATFKADLVCCWASMCNISYDYSKDDTLPVALTKVIRALRQRGIKVYNFIRGEEACEDIDFMFFNYAATHAQTNATNSAYFLGLPIFTGRADTLKHFAYAMSILGANSQMPTEEGRGSVSVKGVLGATVKFIVRLDNIEAAVNMLQLGLSGIVDNVTFTNILDDISSLLTQYPEEVLQTRFLVIATIPTTLGGSNPQYFHAWALCSSEAVQGSDAVFVAREELNGTLVLATSRFADNPPRRKPKTGGGGLSRMLLSIAGKGPVRRNNEISQQGSATYSRKPSPTAILAYLTITDQECGTFLIPVSSGGQVDLTFKTPQRSDIRNSDLMRDRRLHADLRLEDTTMPNPQRKPPLTIDSQTAWKNLQNQLRKGKHRFSTNDAVIQQIGEDRELLRAALIEVGDRYAERLKDGSIYDIDGRGHISALLNIDIGHPELIEEEQEEMAKQRFHEDKKRNSSRDLPPDTA